MYKNFVSLQYVISRVLRNPLMADLNFEAALDYAIECIRRMGVLKYHENKTKKIRIQNNRGELPFDMVNVEGIRRIVDEPTDFRRMNKSVNDYDDSNNNISDYSFRGTYVFTSFEEGLIEILYTGLYLDTDGLPLIPDNVDVISAIEWFIRQEHFMNLMMMGKIQPGIYEKAEQQYCWYMGKAQNSHLIRDIDEREAVSRILSEMFIEPFSQTFKNVNYDRER